MVTTTDDVLLGFAARLNEALDDAGVRSKGGGRQSEAGKRYGVTQKGARKWLEGEGMPDLSRAIQIAIDLGVSLEWLLSGRGPKRPSKAEQSTTDNHPQFAESSAAYAAVRRDADLIRELLAGVLAPLGLNLEHIDIDTERGLSLQAGWRAPPDAHRRGLHALGGALPGERGGPMPGKKQHERGPG